MINAEVIKVDKSLGLVMGYAIVCKIKGEPYFDLQGDHITEDCMMKAAADFMENSRTLGDMHKTDEGGSVVFAWPMTEEVAKAFNLKVEKTGLMIAVRPKNKETLDKFINGEYTGFSIGGNRVEDEEVENED